MKKLSCIPICILIGVLSSIYAGCSSGGQKNKTAERENREGTTSGQRVKIENDILFENKNFRGRKFLTLDDISVADSILIRNYVRKREHCIPSDTCASVWRDCRTNYCGISECTTKIMCCHSVDSQTFEAMTHGGKYGRAACSKEFFEAAIKDAQCGEHKILLRKDIDVSGSYYKAFKVAANAAPGSASEIDVFYSIPLMHGILADKYGVIDSFILYTGFALDNNTKKLIPFEVTYKNGLKSKYYDVSDSQP